MAQNNPAFYDALIAGGCGGTLERWITASSSSAYDGLVDAVEAFATAVDAAIPTDAEISISKINLLQSIAQGIVADRNLSSIDADTFANIAAAIAAAYAEAAARLNNEPPLGGGGTLDPIQHVVWLDPLFTPGDNPSNGSIQSPWTTFGEAWPEMLGSSETGAWKIMLPGYNVSMGGEDDPIPNLNNNVDVVFEGVSRDKTIIGSFFSFGQNGPNNFEFRHLTIPDFNLLGGSNDYTFEDVLIGGSSVGGTLQGTIKLINCAVENLSLGTFGPQLEMYGGTAGGTIAAENGKFVNVAFAVGTSLNGDGSGRFKFIGCDFATGTSINGVNTCEFDPYSYDTFNASGAGNTFSGTRVLTPVVPVIGRVRITGAGNNINLNSEQTFDFGNPIGTPLAEPGSNVVGSWALSPGISARLQKVTVDPGTGHIMVVVANNTGATIFLSNPTDLSIIYQPKTSP